MYYAHFGLKEPPYKITPNTEFFFSGGNRGAILDALTYAITSGEGIVKVVGEVGSGKTMLCRMLQTLLPEKVESVYLANPSVAPEDVLHAIAFELQLDLPPDADRLRVMQVLHAYLLDRYAEGRQVVIFVEEAQGMPLATLEEIRLLSNLETRHDKLLQIVLFGQPELDENLNETQIRQLRERITHSFNLGPLAEQDVADYLIFRLRAAGYFGPHLFSKSAIRMIAKSSEGLVRRINILADKALLAAFSENVYQVTPKHVKAAIRDSEFGAEQLNKGRAQKLYMIAAGILVLGLVLGYLTHLWQSRIAGQASVASVEGVQELSPVLAAEAVAQPEPQSTAGYASVETVSEENTPQTAGVSADILEHRLNVTRQWLNQQPASTVSIQLMGSANDDQLRRQLESLAGQLELDNLYVYRTQVNNAPFLTVLYGSYEDRLAAQEAMRQLPAGLRSYRPQLRTVGGILQETKQLQ
ncbi:MAG: general secretion pathway protein [Betaproteobacteria bacterium HGW-Betaproteobacteria-1]|jgi:type II secretory pathway predicted ATPase ExeA|nr:MAG: general secretion pathway protein [Betaproteobacteria bacterium HGW-Betaproteobacteria-1]